MKKTHWDTKYDTAVKAWLPGLTRAELCMVADGCYSEPGGRHTMDVRRLYVATGASTTCERKIARRRASMFAQAEVSR